MAAVGQVALQAGGRPKSVPADQPYRIIIAGNSADTKILGGPLQVWRGGKDIDWAVVDTGRVGSRTK